MFGLSSLGELTQRGIVTVFIISVICSSGLILWGIVRVRAYF